MAAWYVFHCRHLENNGRDRALYSSIAKQKVTKFDKNRFPVGMCVCVCVSLFSIPCAMVEKNADKPILFEHTEIHEETGAHSRREKELAEKGLLFAILSKCNKKLKYLNYIDDLFAARSYRCRVNAGARQRNRASMKCKIVRKRHRIHSTTSKLKLKALSMYFYIYMRIDLFILMAKLLYYCHTIRKHNCIGTKPGPSRSPASTFAV